jgi:adenylate cyclase
MGVFVGGSKNSFATRCALRMNYVVDEILRPKAEAKFPSLKAKGFVIDHCVGVARSEVFIVRGGVRGDNDLVFVGQAPNIAAKLSELRESPYSTWITWSVYQYLHDYAKLGQGQNMWTKAKRKLGEEEWEVYKSSWHWKP